MIDNGLEKEKRISMGIFDGKTAVVTGSARGIGEQVARTLAANGCDAVVVADILEEPGRKTAQSIEETCHCKTWAYALNVLEESSIVELFAQVRQRFGGADILVNCAGICPTQSIEDTSVEGWNRTLGVNLRGTFLCCREALCQMKEKQAGKIVNTTTISARIGGIGTGMDYVASKGGVLSMTMGIAKQAAKYNINVNSVAPGFIATEMSKNLKHFDPANVPLGRIGEPADVADVVKFLCSEDARYLTGVCIDVNGGVFMSS